MEPVPAAPFLASEQMPPLEVTREEMRALFSASQRNSPIIPLANGLFVTPHGVYASPINTQTGEVMVLHAADPDDMTLGEWVVKDEAEAERLGVPVGTVLPGQYIQDSGNRNDDRYRVVTVRPAVTHTKWLNALIVNDQRKLHDFTASYGTLKRQSADRWISKGVVYNIVERKAKFSLSLIWNKLPEQKTCDVIMTATPGSAWLMDRDTEKVFSGIGGKFLLAASMRARDLTREAAEALIKSDFKKRAPLFMDGGDPFAMSLVPQKPRRRKKPYSADWWIMRHARQSSPLRAAKKIVRQREASKQLMRMVFAVRKMEAAEIRRTAGILLISNTLIFSALYALTGHIASVFVFGGKVVGQFFSKIGQSLVRIMNGGKEANEAARRNLLMEKYAPRWRPNMNMGASLAAEWLPYLHVRPYHELNTDASYDIRLRKSMPEDWGTHRYIFDSARGPIGSVAAPFQFGEHKGTRVDEQNGLIIEYLPHLDICFARLDRGAVHRDRIPDCVVRHFEANDAEKPILMIRYVRQKGAFEDSFLSQNDYLAVVGAITQAPGIPLRPLSDKFPRLREPKIRHRSGYSDEFQAVMNGGIKEGVTNSPDEIGQLVGEAIRKALTP